MSYINKQATIDAIYEKANEELADANHHFLAGVHMATAVVRDMPEQQWIPCSERLPEHPGVYLVTLTAYAEKCVVARWYWPQRGGWVSDERPEAWMPLPAPYKGGGHETD